MRINRIKTKPFLPRFSVGLDQHGRWIVKDRLDRVGGLFTSEHATRDHVQTFIGEIDKTLQEFATADPAVEIQRLKDENAALTSRYGRACGLVNRWTSRMRDTNRRIRDLEVTLQKALERRGDNVVPITGKRK